MAAENKSPTFVVNEHFLCHMFDTISNSGSEESHTGVTTTSSVSMQPRSDVFFTDLKLFIVFYYYYINSVRPSV